MPDRQGRLEGKVAIITGAGSSGPGVGNGKAAAVLFAREGAKVLLADSVKARAEERAYRIQRQIHEIRPPGIPLRAARRESHFREEYPAPPPIQAPRTAPHHLRRQKYPEKLFRVPGPREGSTPLPGW